MSETKSTKPQKVGKYGHSKHSESCGCESVTGVTEEDAQKRE